MSLRVVDSAGYPVIVKNMHAVVCRVSDRGDERASSGGRQQDKKCDVM